MNKKKIVIGVIIAVVIIALCIGGMFLYRQNKIDTMREEGVKDLNAVVNLDDYREEQRAEIEKILEADAKKINKSEQQSEIDEIIEAAQNEIAEIKTDEQLDKEEAEAKKKAEEEAAKKAAEEAAAAAAAQQSYNSTSNYSGGSSNGSDSEGCVGNDAADFY